MSRWYLELRRTEWVLWGYGPKSVAHVAPACVYLNDLPEDEKMDFPFELPEHRPGGSLLPAVEYERREAVGWRFATGTGHDTGWYLADSEEAAQAAAAAWVDRQAELRGEERGAAPFRGVPVHNNCVVWEALMSIPNKKCEHCGGRTSACGDFCQKCKSKLHHAYKRVREEGLLVDTAGGAWWIWSPKGEVLVIGQDSRVKALFALIEGDDREEVA